MTALADYKSQDLPLEVRKTIYAKRKSHDFNKEKLINVLQMEITYHLNKYRDLKFKSIDDPIRGEDLSMTYII